ncbi:hypothetical protein [Actinorugispora endophytica]|uniref:Uncharacterized protein n=1 Tax=Actinorugispora endophytica TaxID=1605990 RepID=A0A4V3D8T7_9ACTN|nr:hypothetical protein [Actinorugispora endophytica]TDQ52991.1 hypothetical protein EV190_105108 [Actinorugispora endophytica]
MTDDPSVARVLGEDVASLWPLLKPGTGNGPAVREELVAVYARRAAV